jgi:hypothetical protein
MEPGVSFYERPTAPARGMYSCLCLFPGYSLDALIPSFSSSMTALAVGLYEVDLPVLQCAQISRH